MTKVEAKVRPLAGQIALVTGASRGIGRGIAVQLGQAGSTVYITGRKPADSLANSTAGLPSLEQTAQEISNRGGTPVIVYCDHSKSEDVKNLFTQIEKDTNGTLDILVNNAFSGIPSVGEKLGKKFYESEPEYWDEMNEVGLRNNYFCSVYAARIMAKRGRGLIVNVSSIGGLKYLFSVAYGVGKEAVDRMSADMGFELKSDGITVVSLWPGAVKTELVEMAKQKGDMPDIFNRLQRTAESQEFAGKAVVALASDKNVLSKSGKIHITGDLADEYGFIDIDGKMPANLRAVRSALEFAGWIRTAQWIPTFLKVPKTALHLGSNKF